jgi:hypothetical protein
MMPLCITHGREFSRGTRPPFSTRKNVHHKELGSRHISRPRRCCDIVHQLAFAVHPSVGVVLAKLRRSLSTIPRRRTMNVLAQLHRDEAGFIVSAELILVSTIVVIGMVVGLSECANGAVEELEDVGSAIGSANQSFHVSGSSGHKACVVGFQFKDRADNCDSECDISCEGGPRPEGPKRHHR